MEFMRNLLLSSLAVTTFAEVHQLFAGNLYAPSSLHLLEFNDEPKSLKKIQTFAADAPHGWIQFNHDKKTIYGSSLGAPRVASYDISSSAALKLASSVSGAGTCRGKTAGFIQPMNKEPYYVFAASWPSPNSCGTSITVASNGTIKDTADSWSYAAESGVHGLAVGEHDGQQLLYSADLNGDTVWTHSIDKTTGKATEIGRLKTSKSGMHPRHLIAHPNGAYLYVLMEAENTLHQVTLDGKTGAAVKYGQSFSLIPSGLETKNYWSATVALSRTGKYLWATTRGRGKSIGYVSCFLLAEDGTVTKKMFSNPMTTGGVVVNGITPAFWNEEYAVFTEGTNGNVEILKLAGKKSGDQGVEYTSAESVAKTTISDGGCCANAIWYT